MNRADSSLQVQIVRLQTAIHDLKRLEARQPALVPVVADLEGVLQGLLAYADRAFPGLDTESSIHG